MKTIAEKRLSSEQSEFAAEYVRYAEQRATQYFYKLRRAVALETLVEAAYSTLVSCSKVYDASMSVPFLAYLNVALSHAFSNAMSTARELNEVAFPEEEIECSIECSEEMVSALSCRDEHFGLVEFADSFGRFLNTLKPRHRKILLMRYEGYDNHEIAAFMRKDYGKKASFDADTVGAILRKTRRQFNAFYAE